MNGRTIISTTRAATILISMNTVTVIDFILARTVVTHEMMMIVVVALIVVGEEVN